MEKKKRRQERVGSVATDPDNLETSMKAGAKAQGAQDLSKYRTSTESVSPFLRLIRGLRNKHHSSSPWEDQCECHRMTRTKGRDCVLMCSLIHTHSLIPPWEDQCEWHRMTRMTGPDCAVMCNLIHTHTHTHTGFRNKYH